MPEPGLDFLEFFLAIPECFPYFGGGLAAHEAGVQSAESYRYLGMALLAAGRADDAIAACKTALVKKPDDASAFFHLALAHRKKGDAKETRKFLIKALEVEPAMAQAWCALGMLDAESGKFTEAAGLFRRA